MADELRTRVRVGPQGRIVVPAALRRRLGIKAGDVLIARAEDDRLVLEPREVIFAEIRKLFEHIPPDVSLVDELIAERREEAARENADE
ncbi:MAG: AbrB/MazE/SpoVT family DNA-binding domain-containing protein [Gaiellaceae bacterium]